MEVISADVTDLRVPTSDNMLGSDPFHKQPDYSAAVLQLNTDGGECGLSIVFTVGAGTDWICHGIRDLCALVVPQTMEQFLESPAQFYRRLIDHHQLRWLHDGVFRMAVGAVVNAMWDLWAKKEGKPLWKLLVDLEPKQIVDCIDWRYLKDCLSPEEAVELLTSRREHVAQREAELRTAGVKAYCTAGWLGLTDEEILQSVRSLQERGFDAFKIKVGRDLQDDLKRLDFMRGIIGENDSLMVDANQFWGVNEAIDHLQHYGPYHLKWIEEPIARDDVMGYQRLSQYFADANFGFACGEHAASPVIWKQLIQSRAIEFCQIDASRLAGVNDLLAVITMAAKHEIPVCPHGGGIGLCNMIQHLSIWDQIAVSGHSENQLVEYIDFLQDVMLHPVETQGGSYVLPSAAGWGLEFEPGFLEQHRFPDGQVWRDRPWDRKGVHFEA